MQLPFHALVQRETQSPQIPSWTFESPIETQGAVDNYSHNSFTATKHS